MTTTSASLTTTSLHQLESRSIGSELFSFLPNFHTSASSREPIEALSSSPTYFDEAAISHVALGDLPTMVIKSQNLQGFKDSHMHRSLWFTGLKRQVKSHDCAIVLLQETHVSSTAEAVGLQRQWCAAMGVAYSAEAPISFWSVGESRKAGVAILVNPYLLGQFSPTNQAFWSDYFISIRSDVLQVHCVYAPTRPKQRSEFFGQLALLRAADMPTIAGGDFNCTLDPINDRWSSVASLRATSECAALDSLLHRWSLVDAVHQRRRIGDTFAERQQFRSLFHTHFSRTGSARLDRVYVSTALAGWVDMVSTVAPQHTSDHQEVSIVLKHPDSIPEGSKVKCLYRPAARNHPLFLERLKPRLERLTGIFLRLPHADMDFDSFLTRVHAEITKTKLELSEIRRRRKHAARRRMRANAQAQTDSRADRIRTNITYNTLRRVQQAGDAIQRGAATTAARFRRVSTREWDQSVTALHSTDVSFEATDTIADRFRKAWTSLYAATPTAPYDFPLVVPECRQLQRAASLQLSSALSSSELSKVLQHLRKNKRAGPDELPNEFYQDFADLMIPVMQRVCQRAMDTGRCPASFAHALIFPVRKNGDSSDPMQYRPISLLNSSYKILAKVLANRVVAVLDHLVGAQQNGYVPARRMEDTIHTMLAALQLSDDEAETNQADSPVVILLDFSKAYDSLDRGFLFNVLRSFGFPPDFISLVQGMHYNTTAQFLANGHRSAVFDIQRGIRQGCPLAPYLFILAMDPLSTAFHERRFDWGLCFGEANSFVHHVFSGFVDDSALFLRHARLVQSALELLKRFGNASGLKVNPTKSHAIFLHPQGAVTREEWLQIPILPRGHTTRYLGIQVGVADLTAANWASRLSSFSSRLSVMARRRHSLVDRAALASSILSPSVLFTANFFWPPAEVSQALDDMVYHFLWHGMYTREAASRWPISADILRMPRSLGGIQAPDLLRDMTQQAAKKLLRWSTLNPSLERTVGALLLRSDELHRPTPFSLELQRPAYLPILSRRRSKHWPKSRAATVWTIGEGELAIAAGLSAGSTSPLSSARAAWWSRLRSLASVRLSTLEDCITATYVLPVWMSRAWEEFCAASVAVLPRQIIRYWTKLNIVGNPWFRLKSDGVVPHGHFGLKGNVTIDNLMVINYANNRLRCVLTPMGSQLVLERHSEHGRATVIHQWILLFLINCPTGLSQSPMTLRPEIPPFTEWRVQLSNVTPQLLLLSSPTITWATRIPRVAEPLGHPAILPLSQCQTRWLLVARCVPVYVDPHPLLHRAAMVWPGSSNTSTVSHFARYLATAIKARFHRRGLDRLEKRLASWRKRDPEIAELLQRDSWASIWNQSTKSTAEDRVFRYKLRLGAHNTRRGSMATERNCPLRHCDIQEPDTLLHVFWQCGVSQAVWQMVFATWHQSPSSLLNRQQQLSVFSEVNPFVPTWVWHDDLVQLMDPIVVRKLVRVLWVTLARSFLRTLWRVRNAEVHGGTVSTPPAIFTAGVLEFCHRLDALKAAYAATGDITRLVIVTAMTKVWKSPLSLQSPVSHESPGPDRLTDILFFDGGSRGNPGPGAGGAVHITSHGNTWTIKWFGIEVCRAPDTTNNVAEYTGLILGLQNVSPRSGMVLLVVGDSQLVLQQLQGHRAVRSRSLQRLFINAMRTLDQLATVRFSHHRRHYNKMADLLTNIGMDTNTSTSLKYPHIAASPIGSQLHAWLDNDLAPILFPATVEFDRDKHQPCFN